MKKYYKKLIAILTISMCTLIQAVSLQDRIIDTGAGVATGIAANFALNFLEVLGHELGHAFTNKALTGDPIKISVTRSYYGGPFLSLVAPWKGTAYMTTGNVESYKDNLRTIAGPLAGIATTHGILHLLDIFENYYLRHPQDQRSHDSWKQPLPFLKDCYTLGETIAHEKFLHDKDFKRSPIHGDIPIKANTRSLRIGAIALRLLRTIRCVHIIGEAIYGFTPVTIPSGVGDGQILWRNLLKRSDKNIPAWNCFALLTNSAIYVPMICGFIKTLLTHKNVTKE